MKNTFRSLLVLCSCLIVIQTYAQPEPCGPNPAMTSYCATACVICDIDGFTGINDLTETGQPIPGFCTTFFHNMQYIAFVAGSVDLSIQVTVGTCTGGNGANSIELGFYESLDCENFTPITFCDTDVEQGSTQTFSNIVPLIIGQHYYMVIDGSNGSNCEWTFRVTEGTTEVLALASSGEITGPAETCPDLPTTFSTTEQEGAAIYYWTIDGVTQSETTPEVDLIFPSENTYEVCVRAANVCDEAPPSCTTIHVRMPETLVINEILCQGECVEANSIQFCQSGTYEEIITLPNGCDSLILIDIEVLPNTEHQIDLWICNDNFYSVGDINYNQTGSYLDTLISNNGCDSVIFLDLLTIECEIVGTSDQIPVICQGTASGSLIFSIEQGEPPLTYTYTNIMDATISGSGSTNLLDNNEIPNLMAGVYQIHIADNFGNDVVVLQELTEPEPILISITAADYNGFGVSCFSSNGILGNDGQLMAQVTGGIPPYTYAWDDGQTGQVATGLMAQEYTLTLNDAVGCVMEQSFSISAPLPISPNVNFLNPSCDGFETGAIHIEQVTGGTPPYLYALDDNNFQNDSLFSDLSEGTYQVFIQDSNDCIELVESSIQAPDIPIINFPDHLNIYLGDSLMIEPLLNNISIAEIIWTNGETLSCTDCLTPVASPVNTTEYELTIVSEDGCSTTEMVKINVEKRRRVFVPNIFSPNLDGINDKLVIFAGHEVASIVQFTVFDRWGNLIFEQKDFLPNESSLGWNGSYNGKRLDPASFIWAAEVSFIDQVNLIYSGSVILID